MKKTLSNLAQLIIGFALVLLLLFILQCSARGQTLRERQWINSTAADAPAAAASPAPAVPTGLTQEIWDTVFGSTNFAFAFGGGKRLTDSTYLAYVAYLHDLSQHAALLLAYDYMWSKNVPSPQTSATSANLVRGGLTLKDDVYPFKNFGATNFFVTVFAADCITTATSGGNNGQIGNLALTGADYKFHIWKSLDGHFGGFYEYRQGNGPQWDGNYACLELALSWRW